MNKQDHQERERVLDEIEGDFWPYRDDPEYAFAHAYRPEVIEALKEVIKPAE